MEKENIYEDLKDIDVKTYDWSTHVVRSLTKMLKVNMKLHANQQDLQGDIFLCNHFSRFETFIPQFLIYEETGAYSCAIASSEFFKKDSVLANYLNSLGVIPHDHQNLFSNLARQIFLGRKVIIFPEGGMVKDHRVLDNKGRYSIYSAITGERRKQHTGAAVLAQGIEAFKTTLGKSDDVAVESTGNTGYFVREIKRTVKTVRIINPTQFKIISHSVKKTDEKDAEIIAKYLSKGLVPEVRMKSKEDGPIPW